MKWQSLDLSQITAAKLPELLVVYGTDFSENQGFFSDFITEEEKYVFTGEKNQMQNQTRLACRAVLRRILSIYTGIPSKQVELTLTKRGKPCIANSGLFFNVSHTDSSFLIGISVSGRVGTDIEILKGDEDINEISLTAFSAQEIKNLKDSSSFLQMWTKKEALLKAAGLGLTDNLREISSNALIDKWGLKEYSFICPGNETASVVARSKSKLTTIHVV